MIRKNNESSVNTDVAVGSDLKLLMHDTVEKPLFTKPFRSGSHTHEPLLRQCPGLETHSLTGTGSETLGLNGTGLNDLNWPRVVSTEGEKAGSRIH